jgi:hypothetical protein
MNKIKTKVSREANFVYHMLSVSKCGYDNEYGREYSKKHSINDLNLLKENEKLITVSGGEHCGELYSLFVSIPASLDSDAIEYYRLLSNLFKTGDIEKNIDMYNYLYSLFLSGNSNQIIEAVKNTYNSYNHLKPSIILMSDVMIHNYEIYCSKIWEKSKQELLPYSGDVQTVFDNDDISEKLEVITGESLKNNFIASFCNSIDGGAEAIDISDSQDIFGIGRNYEWAKKFISHEYAIYLLKQALLDTTAFTDIKYWNYTESLAEFYLGMICDETGSFKNQRYIIDFYKAEYDKNRNITASELYKKAIEKY